MSDDLGDRMKGYEHVTRSYLMKRTPVIIRVGGRAFHTFTKRLKHVDPSVGATPFSVVMHNCMNFTTETLVRSIQGCVLGYTQSDEITLLLRDWDTFTTESWFGGNIQKIASLCGAIASNAFNLVYSQVDPPNTVADMAQFDARVHNIPREEVANHFIWRQNDASRNSVQMLGHYHFSQKQMHGKNNSQVQDMLMLEKGINWNDIPTWMKRGSCVIRTDSVITDNEIPIFTQDRAYIERLLVVEE
jgi:tRNA(His) guanylyltransferase